MCDQLEAKPIVLYIGMEHGSVTAPIRIVADCSIRILQFSCLFLSSNGSHAYSSTYSIYKYANYVYEGNDIASNYTFPPV